VKRSARIPTVGILLLAASGMVGCDVGVRTRALFGQEVKIQVVVAPRANQDHPIAVDLLRVYDGNLLAELLKLSAGEWFEKREQFKRDYPEKVGFESWEWEWTPGQSVPILTVPLDALARGGIIFANYFTKGAHRVRVDPNESILINLRADGFSVEPFK
jgi:type VI secretion system protein